MNLDELAKSARAEVEWTDARATRVLASTLLRREKHVAHARFARRSLGVASAAAVIVLVLLRGATAPSANASTHPTSTSPTIDQDNNSASMLATQGDLLGTGDGGYARD